MSAEDNVKLVQRLFEKHNRGAAEVMGSYEQLFHPDLEWLPVIVGGPEGASYRGKDGLERWYAQRDDSFASASVEIETCRAMAPDVVLALGRSIAKGRASGAEVSEEVGLVISFEDGLIRLDCAYGSHSEAEQAAKRLVAEQHA